MSNNITKFNGVYRFLSNFYPAEVLMRNYPPYDPYVYPTVEHAYQAAKTLDLEERSLIYNCANAAGAKKLGRKLVLRNDWEQIKLDLLLQKFSKVDSKNKLLATGNTQLIEENDWKDTFWGVCKGIGDNHLGKLLMEIRGEIRGDTKN